MSWPVSVLIADSRMGRGSLYETLRTGMFVRQRASTGSWRHVDDAGVTCGGPTMILSRPRVWFVVVFVAAIVVSALVNPRLPLVPVVIAVYAVIAAQLLLRRRRRRRIVDAHVTDGLRDGTGTETPQ